MDIQDIAKLDIPEKHKDGLLVLNKNSKIISSFVVDRDYDWFHLNIGREGVGKSAFSVLFAKLLDPTFSVDRIVFNYDEFKRAVVTAKPGQAIVADEGGLLFFSRNAMKGQQKEIIQLLTIMRQRNLIVIINIPSIKIVESYVKEHRVRSMTHIKARGVAWGYGMNKVQRMVGIMAKTKDKRALNLVNPGFKIRFPDAKMVFPEFWDAYRKKKDAMIIGENVALQDLLKDQEDPNKLTGDDSLLYNLDRRHLKEKFGISYTSIDKMRKLYPEIAKKNVLGRWKYSEMKFKDKYYKVL